MSAERRAPVFLCCFAPSSQLPVPLLTKFDWGHQLRGAPRRWSPPDLDNSAVLIAFLQTTIAALVLGGPESVRARCVFHSSSTSERKF